jgi:LuxR family maltose regulon positive regulatory protein
MESVDTFASYAVFLARLRLAQGDLPGAVAILDEAQAFVRQHNFVFRMHDVTAAQVLTLLRQGHLAAAAQLAETHELPISQARVHLAQGDPAAALAVLRPLRQQVEAKGWADEQLKVIVLQAIAHHLHGEKDKAVHLLGEALSLAEPGGFIRIFVDEGLPMMQLLSEAAAHRMMPGYIGKLLAAFGDLRFTIYDLRDDAPPIINRKSEIVNLVEPLSQREIAVLQLMAQGLSNRQISERLFLALSTVKGHNLKIFGKLQVQRRTEAVARARALGLL